MALSYEEQDRLNRARANQTRSKVERLGRVPLLAWRFRVQIDYSDMDIQQYGQEILCSEVSGLECDLKMVEYQEGGNNGYVHHFRGQASYPNLVLKRGLMADDKLWRWHQQVIHGIGKRHGGQIQLLDGAGDEAMRWSFAGAMPVKWSVPGLNAGSSALAFESVEFVHRGLSLDNPAEKISSPPP